MRVADAAEGMALAVGYEIGYVAKVEVVRVMKRGRIAVRLIDGGNGRPACLSYWSQREADDEFQVLSRFCWPWTERTTELIAERRARSVEAQRRRAELEEIVERIGCGTVAGNGRVFFDYDEMIDIAPCIPSAEED